MTQDASDSLCDWQYDAMLAQDFQLFRAAPAVLLRKLKKLFVAKHRPLFEDKHKHSVFLFSFKILTEDEHVAQTLINGLLLSFRLILENCLKTEAQHSFFFFESLLLLPDYRKKGASTPESQE